MQVKTQRGALTIGSRQQKPVVSLSLTPESPTNYLIIGVGLGVVLGFILGTVAAFTLGSKSLLLAQTLWNRLFGAESDSERVHFELLLQ